MYVEALDRGNFSELFFVIERKWDNWSTERNKVHGHSWELGGGGAKGRTLTQYFGSHVAAGKMATLVRVHLAAVIWVVFFCLDIQLSWV